VSYRFNFQPVLARADLFLEGVSMTVAVSLLSMALAVVLGLIVALASLSRFRFLRLAGRFYVQLFRGLPLYVYIIWLYYGLALWLGVKFTPLQAGVICLATLYGAYLAEIDRGAIQSIPRQQSEAALSLGLSPAQTFRFVVLPQALRVIVPPSTNLFAVMLMDSSLLSVIGVTDLMRLIRVGVSDTFRSFEFYTAGALIYVGLVLSVSRLSARLERGVRFQW
jgi:His/Glu/Gln/Arg/opine family amino acid ABC transporter permease subunit